MNKKINLNNAWEHFQAFQNAKNTIVFPLQQNTDNDPVDTFFNFQNAWNNHHNIPQVQEEYKVAKFVKDVYFTIYPDKEGEFYPSNWIIPSIEAYRKIRNDRAKKLKGNPKDAFKGLRTQIIVACILRCLLIRERIGIPVPLLLRVFNEALKRSNEKKEREPITMEKLEKYRTDAKKGIKASLSTVIPQCYKETKPEDLVTFTGFSILRLHKEQVLKAKRIAKHSWNDGDGDFPDSTSPSIVAIGALFVVCIMTNTKVNYKVFGISKQHLQTAYRRIVKSENPAVLRELTKVVSPSKVQYSPKKSSVKR